LSGRRRRGGEPRGSGALERCGPVAPICAASWRGRSPGCGDASPSPGVAAGPPVPAPHLPPRPAALLSNKGAARGGEDWEEPAPRPAARAHKVVESLGRQRSERGSGSRRPRAFSRRDRGPGSLGERCSLLLGHSWRQKISVWPTWCLREGPRFALGLFLFLAELRGRKIAQDRGVSNRVSIFFFLLHRILSSASRFI
jgi:hypothetical protein